MKIAKVVRKKHENGVIRWRVCLGDFILTSYPYTDKSSAKFEADLINRGVSGKFVSGKTAEKMANAIDGAMVTAVNPKTHPEAFRLLKEAKKAYKKEVKGA